MKKNNGVYFPSNEDYTTKFGNIIQRIDDEKVRIILNPNSEFEWKLKKPQILGAIYDEIENKVSELNPSINKVHTDYSDTTEFFYFTKHQNLVVKHNEKSQRKALWVYFQAKNIKIQFSSDYKDKLIQFYKKNQANFDRIFNTNEDEFHFFFSDEYKPNRKKINKLTRSTADNNAKYYYSFQFVNFEAIDLAFKFIQEIKLIS